MSSSRRAIAMAREAPEDPYAGLAPAELIASGPFPDIDSEDRSSDDPQTLQNRALAAEKAALAVPGVTNSSGGSAGSSASAVALATSTGFSGAYRSTGHSASVSVIAGEGAAMQRDSAWHGVRHLTDLDAPEEIGRLAGERAVARLNPRKAEGRDAIRSCSTRAWPDRCSAISSAPSPAPRSPASPPSSRTSWGSRSSRPGLRIVDDPLRPRGLRSRPFDSEGLPVSLTDLIEDGILKTWIADSASARQLGIRPTGHAVRGVGGPPGAGPSNLLHRSRAAQPRRTAARPFPKPFS